MHTAPTPNTSAPAPTAITIDEVNVRLGNVIDNLRISVARLSNTADTLQGGVAQIAGSTKDQSQPSSIQGKVYEIEAQLEQLFAQITRLNA